MKDKLLMVDDTNFCRWRQEYVTARGKGVWAVRLHHAHAGRVGERQQGTTVLFPVRIDDTVMALETGWPTLTWNTRNIGNCRRWKMHDAYQQAFARLLRDLTAVERKPAV
jgi:hypothetical protein